MKLRVAVLLLSTLLADNALALNPAIVASINGQEIDQRKLNNAVEGFLRSKGVNSGAIRDPNKFKKIRHEVLDILISQELLWQAAKKDKLLASDQDVEKALQQVSSQFADKNDFISKIREGGFDEKSYRKNLKQQLSAQQWLEKNVYKKLSVDNKEIHTFYTENKDKFVTPEQVKARHILMTLKKDSPEEERSKARSTLEKLKKDLAAGADFAELAKNHSQGPSAPNGGDLGYFARGQMVKPFEDVAFSAKQGEVSEIVETQFGYHLIQVLDKKPSVEYSETDVTDYIRQYLMSQKSGEAVQKVVEKLRQKAKIELNTI